MKKCFGFFLSLMVSAYAFIVFSSGCAQIGAPTGGPKDTLAPVLVKATPPQFTRNFKGNRISLNFDEYLDVQDLQNNLLVSPVQKNNPVILYNLKNITIKFRDTLLPNTTYTVNFGNAVKDVNEGNILREFTYVFSTGNILDSLSYSGKVFLAETGKADSTMIALLYRNADDSAVQKRKPDYIARVKSDGSFIFKNLPSGNFKVYALKDGDGGKTYNSKNEVFAFADSDVIVSANSIPITLYASALEKEVPKPSTTPPARKTNPEKNIRLTTNLEQNKQSLLQPLMITFSNPLKVFDAQKIQLSDTNYVAVANTKYTLDSTAKILTVNIPWQPEANYILKIEKDAVQDSAGLTLAKNDTLKFLAKSQGDYGRVVLRFTGLLLEQHPVIQFIESGAVKYSFPITSNNWSNKLFPPGDYEVRILYDINQNGIWDPGNYSKKLQPEKVISLPQKIQIKADWDNERDIKL